MSTCPRTPRPHGQAFPASGGYSAAAWAGVAAMAVTIIVITGLA